jgi:glycosyltransferase involved in cell wall biosynthesis
MTRVADQPASDNKVESPVNPYPNSVQSAKILLFENSDWYLYNFRLSLAKSARSRGAEVIFVAPAGDCVEKIEAEGFRFIAVPMVRRSLNPMLELRLLWALWQVYRKERPDIAHHFSIKNVVYGGIVAKLAGVHGVVDALTGMGYIFCSKDLLARALRPFVCGLLRFSMNSNSLRSRLIVQNPDDRNIAIQTCLIDAQRIELIPSSGVNTQKFQPNPKPRSTERPVTVAFAARLLWDKGVGDFVEAARILSAEGHNVSFVIAGAPDRGNPDSVSDKQLEAWQAENIVSLLGHVEDMAGLLRECDVVVLPTRYGEGVPRSLIEAAATGLPIVTLDAPGCRDIVLDGVNGFLIPPPYELKALIDAIRKLIVDPVLASRMGTAGRARALQKFDERLVIDRTLQVYRDVLPTWQTLAST